MSPYDWLVTQDNNLWQGVSSATNPCPSGFWLATETEWIAEQEEWATADKSGAFGSVLKLPAGGKPSGTDVV